MRVIPQGVLAVRGVRTAYPFVSVPPQVVSEYLPASPAGTGNLNADPAMGVVTPPRVFVPWDQTWLAGGVSVPVVGDPYRVLANPPADSDRPFVVWESIGGEAVSLFPLLKMPQRFQGLETRWEGDPAEPPELTTVIAEAQTIYRRGTVGDPPVASWVSEQLSCQGFTLYLDRSAAGGWEQSSVSSTWQVEFEVGRGNGYKYRVGGGGLSPITLEADEGAGAWRTVREAPRSASDVGEVTGNRPPTSGPGFAVEVTFLNDRLSVSVGGSASPLVHVLPKFHPITEPAITRVEVRGAYFSQFGWSLHPHCWSSDAEMTRETGYSLLTNVSKDKEAGASLLNKEAHLYGVSKANRVPEGQALDHEYPSGSQTTYEQASQTAYRIAVSNRREGIWQGRDYSLQTPQLTKVNVYRPGVVTFSPGQPVYPIPKSIRETVTFDPNALTVHHSLDVTLDNYYGQYARQSGAVAVQLQLGYAQPAWGNFYRFTGRCDTYTFQRPRAGAATVTLHCTDLTDALDQPIGAPPDMDGWNHYFAIAYLLEYCGVPRSAMAFRDLVPGDPFWSAVGDPAPYFLPFGAGMHPWTPRNRIMPVRALIDYLRKPTGFLFFVDAQGYFRYEPWLPEFPGAAVRTFTESATGADGAALTEFWNFQYRVSTRRVRNQVILVGVDQFSGDWAPIVQKREDGGSIDAPPGVEPFNYVGYRRAFVWVDPRFSTRAFASESADRLLAILRIPEATASFSCWMQPDLYPMDVIYVNEAKSGAEGVPFYVLGMTNEYAVSGGEITCQSHVTGRYLV